MIVNIASFPLVTPLTLRAASLLLRELYTISKLKYSLSYPDKYNRKSKANYSTFKGYLYTKLWINCAVIGAEPE